MTFYILAAAIAAALMGFAFWRGRRYERAHQKQRRGGMITAVPNVAPDWDWPSPKGPAA